MRIDGVVGEVGDELRESEGEWRGAMILVSWRI